jgi:hypothetical protein
MAIMKKQLKGENFCNLSCTEQKEVIHPENDITDVLMTEETSDAMSLKDWILGGTLPPNPTVCSSLIGWLETYYNGDVFYQMPTASASTKGGVKVGQYLTIDDEVLSVDKNSLNIPTAFTLTPASHIFDGEEDKYELGGVNIFNEFEGKTEQASEYGITIRDGGKLNYNLEGTEHLVTFSNPIEYIQGTIIPANTTFYLLPVNIIKKNSESEEEVIDQNCAVTNIPTYLFEKDWNETLSTSPYFIKNKPVLATVATSGSYNDLSNKPTIPAAQVQSDWNANSGMGQILNKPALSIERVITDITPEMLNDFEALNNIANTLYSGNSVINLDSEIAEAALTKLLDKNCTIKTITLYIPKSVGSIKVIVDDPSNVTCYQNQSKVTYIDKSINEKSFEFDFSGDDMTRIDYFKNESDVILYITGYTYLQPTSNN